ncbi:MAG: M48 family metallopeptidase [Gammaproteobacteria bacterium]
MSGEISGHYIDGQSSTAHPVTASLIDGAVILEPPLRPPTPLSDINIGSRVGTTPRQLIFTDGAVVESSDHAVIDHWSKIAGNHGGWLHRWESRSIYALVALLLVVALFAGSARWGIPWASNLIAHALPTQITEQLGDLAVESLDRLIFSPSALPPERVASLQDQFARLLPGENTEYDYRLEFRGGGPVGANALAFPNGIIIMTDELVELAERDQEIQAIWLHEIGHLQHRHSLRQILAHSGLAILTTTLTGDITAAGSLVVGTPNLLMEAGYSRQMETEADTYALAEMQRLGLATEHFANIMERLELAMFDPSPADQARENEAPAAGAEEGRTNSVEMPNFFSTHPLTKERIHRFRPAVRSAPPASAETPEEGTK